jgi:threonine/homoserine/homoserine lactone efflux protein
LRPGIICTVTGLVVLAHYFLAPAGTGRLSRRNELIVGIVLVVLGIPLFVVGALSR